MKNANKLIFGLLVLGFAYDSFGKVSDFNAIISENIKAQNELHGEVKETMEIARQELRSKGENRGDGSKYIVVESKNDSYNSPSKKFRFRKEVYQYSPSVKKQLKRVATEMKQMNHEE